MRPWETFTNQKQWEKYIKDLLKRNNKALIKAAMLIYNNQTESEKQNLESTENNKIGFDKFDAGVLTRICKRWETERKITISDLDVLRSRIPRYWKQIMIISKNQIKNDYEQLSFDSLNIKKKSIEIDKLIPMLKGVFAGMAEYKGWEVIELIKQELQIDNYDVK